MWQFKIDFNDFDLQRILQIEINKTNEIVRGWVNYFRVDNSARSFSYVKEWLEKKVRKYMRRMRKNFTYGLMRRRLEGYGELLFTSPQPSG